MRSTGRRWKEWEKREVGIFIPLCIYPSLIPYGGGGGVGNGGGQGKEEEGKKEGKEKEKKHYHHHQRGKFPGGEMDRDFSQLSCLPSRGEAILDSEISK